MEQARLSYKNSRINYYRFGSGNRLVLCFHGYGEDGSTYAFLEKLAGAEYHFIALDLPFHGSTDWMEETDFLEFDLVHIIQQILEKDTTFSGKQFSLMGYSLGGRIALSLYHSRPELVDRIVLLAPDGLKINPWYWLATQSWAGHRFFAFTMKHPSWFFGFLKGMNKLGMVNTSIFKFVNYYIGDEKVRMDLYNRWTSLRRFKPNLSHIRLLIRQHKTPVRLLYGKHDRIILPIRGEKFMTGIENYCTLTILPSGHQVLQEKYIEEIKKALSDTVEYKEN